MRLLLALLFAFAATQTFAAANRYPLSVDPGLEYEIVAKSQTAQVLGTTGGTGDYLKGCLIVPETTAAGTVALLDGSTSVNIFVTGTLADLSPIYEPFGVRSTTGPWKITTGDNVHVICSGDFAE